MIAHAGHMMLISDCYHMGYIWRCC